MKNLMLLSLLFISGFGFSQGIEWQKSLGGTGTDWATSIEQTTDGGYIVAGSSGSLDGDVTGNNGNLDYWVIKLDASRNITWQKSLGGSNYDRARSIQQTTDGGYIVAGTTESDDGDITDSNGQWDIWVVKLDAAGNMSWQKSLGGSSYEKGYSIHQTTDGGYIVSGWSISNDGDVTGNHGSFDFWVVKLDTAGNITWQKSLGGSGTDSSFSIQQTADEGYIVAGSTTSNDGDVTGNNGGMDYWVVKLDASGNITWQKSLGGSLDERVWSIQQTADLGYIVYGWSDSNDGDVSVNYGAHDCWVVKLDSSGDITWERSLGGSANDWAYSIQQTTDGGYIAAGSTDSNDGDIAENNGSSDYWIVKLDPSGSIIWEQSLGGSDEERANSVDQTTDGGYVVTGQSKSIDGDISGHLGGTDMWVVKLSSDSASIGENKSLQLNLYPNPTTNKFTITADKVVNTSFKIVDAQGKEVLSGKMKGKEQSFDISSLSKGIYSIVFDDIELPVLSVIKE